MSNVTSIILIFSSLEEEEKRISEVNTFQRNNGHSINLKSIEDSLKSNIWYGGNKYMLGMIYMGAYDDINVDAFVKHVSENVLWEEKVDVQLLIKSEDKNDLKYRLIGFPPSGLSQE